QRCQAVPDRAAGRPRCVQGSVRDEREQVERVRQVRLEQGQAHPVTRNTSCSCLNEGGASRPHSFRSYFGVASAWTAFWAFSACSSCRPSQNSSTIFSLNAGRSSGFRLVTRPWSTTTSLSTHSPPALRMSVLRLGHDVTLRPRTT